MFIIPKKISNSITFWEFFAESTPNCVTSISDELIKVAASDSNSVFVDWYIFTPALKFISPTYR